MSDVDKDGTLSDGEIAPLLSLSEKLSWLLMLNLKRAVAEHVAAVGTDDDEAAAQGVRDAHAMHGVFEGVKPRPEAVAAFWRRVADVTGFVMGETAVSSAPTTESGETNAEPIETNADSDETNLESDSDETNASPDPRRTNAEELLPPLPKSVQANLNTIAREQLARVREVTRSRRPVNDFRAAQQPGNRTNAPTRARSREVSTSLSSASTCANSSERGPPRDNSTAGGDDDAGSNRVTGLGPASRRGVSS